MSASLVPYSETVVIERHIFDDFGDIIDAETTTFNSPNWVFAPRGVAEQADRRTTVTQTIMAYTPYNVDINATDVVIRRNGDRLQVVGVPQRWKSPFTGWEAGAEVELEKVKG